MTIRKQFGSGSLRQIQGFNLIELLVVMVILVLVLGLATPSFVNVQNSARANAPITAFHQDIVFARSRAATTRRTVSIVPVGGNWSAGWRVFTDFNDDGVLNGADAELRRGDAASNATLVAADNVGAALAVISFGIRGEVLSGVGFVASSCASGYRAAYDEIDARNLAVSVSGRPDVAKGQSTSAGATCI